MPRCENPTHTERRPDGRCRACLKAAQMRHYRANTPGYKQRASEWARKNKQRRSYISRRYKYGDVPPQPEKCEICNKRKAQCVDHDHNTGRIRGWLCTRCNSALGAFGDSVDGLCAAIEYVLRAW